DRRVPGDLLLGHPGVQGDRDHRPVPAAVRPGAGHVPRPPLPPQHAPQQRHPEGGGLRMSAAITTPPVSDAPPRPSLLRRIAGFFRADSLPTLAALLIFVLMLIYGEAAYGRIFQFSTVSNLFINNAHLIILAVALTFVIISGGIDLSVGAIIALSSVSGAMLAEAGWSTGLVILVMILIGSTLGLLSGILIQFFNVQPFIATPAMMFLGRGLASMLSTVPVRLEGDSGILLLGTKIKVIDGPKVNDLVITPGVLIALVVVIVSFVVLHRTRTGRTVYAIGGSEQSAARMGLPVLRTKLMLYVVSGTLSGIAAVVYTARLGSAQNITGIGWELDAIAAAVIGGTLLTGGFGYVLGSVVGALV